MYQNETDLDKCDRSIPLVSGMVAAEEFRYLLHLSLATRESFRQLPQSFGKLLR